MESGVHIFSLATTADWALLWMSSDDDSDGNDDDGASGGKALIDSSSSKQTEEVRKGIGGDNKKCSRSGHGYICICAPLVVLFLSVHLT